MKKIFGLISLFMISSIALGQTPVSYTGVVSTKDTNLTKDELYSRGVLWVSETFKSPGDVIKLSDKENGLLQGSGSMIYNHGGFSGGYVSGHITFNFKLYFKKGKYKYEFSNFVHAGYNEAWSYGLINEGESNKAGWGKYLEDIKSSINNDIASMIKTLETSINQNVNNNW
jgi:hypothetical protein